MGRSQRSRINLFRLGIVFLLHDQQVQALVYDCTEREQRVKADLSLKPRLFQQRDG